MSKKVYRDGKWQQGSAAPEHLREDLRVLPSELVTKDEENANAVHVLDAEHIRDSIVDDWAKGKLGEDPDKEERRQRAKDAGANKLPPVGVSWPFHREERGKNQHYIDTYKKIAAKNLLQQISHRIETGTLRENEPTVWHMWFPTDDVNNHAIRMGNPPADQDRPKYLRGLNLVIDLNDYVGPIEKPEESRIITDI